MTITPDLFAAYLKCPTKCWLRQTGEPASGNVYAEWVRDRDEAARVDGTKRLIAEATEGSVAHQPPTENLKTATWRLATDVVARTANTETRIAVVERVASAGQGKAAQFVPVRFVWRNKLHRDDKLLLAFDALALAETLGREVPVGKIIHGDDSAVLNVKLAPLMNEARKIVEKSVALLASPTPPDLVLNRHCSECEFQARCRKIAVEKDDLSLLARMSEKERQKLRSKGIFTVTQLSYTFRPRRRPKRQRDKPEKYQHALKALAIRAMKIHIVGSPELKIEGTPVYLDVEGLPDRDFYYLIGVRIGNGESAAQHSLWAATIADEEKIWREFLGILETVEKPVLIHYGSYETTFLKRMCGRFGSPADGSPEAKAINSPLNLVSFLFARIYFPTHSNGLKEIGTWLGCKWSSAPSSGADSIIWRIDWEHMFLTSLRQKLTTYNMEDCIALQRLTEVSALIRIQPQEPSLTNATTPEFVPADSQASSTSLLLRRFSSPISDFELINKAARWDFQRDRIYIRTDERLRRLAAAENARAKKERTRFKKLLPINTTVICQSAPTCPFCGKAPSRHYRPRTLILYDLRFGRFGLKRWVVRYRFNYSQCGSCLKRYGRPGGFWPQSEFGRNLVAFVLYEIVELCVPQMTAAKSLVRLFGLRIGDSTINSFKASAAACYAETRRAIQTHMIAHDLIHADETPIALKDRRGYVWVFASMDAVSYFYSDTREGAFLREKLNGFEGVLVSDFYAAYDSIPCAQQKCLLHLMRDLNEAVLDRPFDEELRDFLARFGLLLKGIVETIDRWGLKRRFLAKHIGKVEDFFHDVVNGDYKSEAVVKIRERFQKCRPHLFTFLKHDGIPWNNNNAEHAIKAFARIRRFIGGESTPKGIEDYLILLSVCQTCKYIGVDFLDFLRSGEKDVHAFAEKHRRRKPAHQSTAPAMFLADPATQAMGADESAI